MDNAAIKRRQMFVNFKYENGKKHRIIELDNNRYLNSDYRPRQRSVRITSAEDIPQEIETHDAPTATSQKQ